MDLDAAAFETKDHSAQKLLKASRTCTRTSSVTKPLNQIMGNATATEKRSLRDLSSRRFFSRQGFSLLHWSARLVFRPSCLDHYLNSCEPLLAAKYDPQATGPPPYR